MSRVIINSVELAKLFRSEQGPIMRNMAIRATNVQRLAKSYVGYSKISFTGEHLRDEIVKRFVQDAKGSAVAVGIFGKDAGRALMHHQGTSPHVIVPKKGKALAFIWGKGRLGSRRVLGAGYVFFKKVHHPGTAANPFLLKALYEGVNQGGAAA
jgi:hypothetical protein